MKQLLEQKHGTRIIVFALLLTMLAWLVPANVGVVKAAEGNTKIPVDGGYLLFDKETGAITGHEGDIKDVIIPDVFEDSEITTIGNGAFHNCSSLTSVNIPDSVTTIGNSAFNSCSSLTSVSIPSSVAIIEEGAFGWCSSLTSIDVEVGNPNYSSQDGVLFDKAKKQLIQYPIGNKRTSYEVPISVTTIGNWAFADCSNLMSVSIPNSVTTIGEFAFSSCNSLTSVSIPDSVITIGRYAFDDCSSLTSVSIPNSVITIGDCAFSYCSSLMRVSIPNSVKSIGSNAFHFCSSLTSIDVEASNQNYSSQDGVLFDRAKEQLIRYPIGNRSTSYEVPNSVTTIGYSAFRCCSSLTSMVIPASVTTIGRYAFDDCSSLMSVSIPNSVTSIGEHSFSNCNSLTSVSVPSSVTSIGEEAFGYQWAGGGYLKVLGFKIYSYSNDSAAAKYAKENGFDYAIVDSGENNNKNGDSNGQNNVSTVPDKPAAVTIKTGTTVKDKKSNGSYIVTQTKQTGGTVTYKAPLDKKKTSVTIPATVKIEGKTYKVTVIEKNAFKGNQKLKTVKIGSNIEKIGANAFNKCTKLKTVKLPSKVKTIQKGAFANCKNLRIITIQTKKLTKKTVGAGAFKEVSSKATVKVPKGKAKAYKTLLRSKGLSKKAKVK